MRRGVLIATLPVTVRDTDEAALMLSDRSLRNLDEGESDSFTVALAVEPIGDVQVRLTSSDETVLSSPALLSFTTLNWNVPQTVTVTAVDDVDAIPPGNVTITLQAGGGGFDGVSGEVSVYVTDNDAAGLVVPEDEVKVVEEDTATFPISLLTQPSGEVTLTFAQPENTDVTVDTDTGTEGLQNTLTFTPDNWRDAQQVTVLAGHDEDAVADTATIVVTASGADYSLTEVSGKVTVAVEDNDPVGLILSVGGVGLTLDEGQVQYVLVRLATEPSVDTVLRIASNDELAVSASSGAVGPDGADNVLRFDASDWNIDQRIQLSAVQDADRNDEEVTITVSARGGEYEGVVRRFNVNVRDDDASARPERERQGAKLILAEIARAIHASTDEAISVRFDAARDERSATVAGHRLSLDRSLVSDIASAFAGRAGGAGRLAHPL